MLSEISKDLASYGNPEKKKILQYFFKTGPGQYGEGDVFLGARVGEVRGVAKKYSELPFRDIKKLLLSKIHEERQCALLMLVHNFEKGNDSVKKEIYDFYIAHADKVNNWDLVDLSAPKIVGAYLIDKDKSKLYKLAESEDLWEKRISVIATYYFIKNDLFEDTLKLSELLLNDTRDLIHKAVGWMLREIGKRDQDVEEEFLKKHYKTMPRTMLRYAIEKFNEEKRKFYMSK